MPPRRARKTGFLPQGAPFALSGPAAKESAFQLERPRSGHVPTQAVGVYLGQFCLTSTLWFFLTWFPTYLVKYRGMDFIKSGFLASVPFLAAFIGVLCSGVLSDFLIRRGATVGLARKLPIILGLLISTSMIGANFTDSTPWVIFFLAVAFFGNGLASITWSLVSALAPVRLLGLTGGVFNFVGNLSSICTPIVIGLLVSGQLRARHRVRVLAGPAGRAVVHPAGGQGGADRSLIRRPRACLRPGACLDTTRAAQWYCASRVRTRACGSRACPT